MGNYLRQYRKPLAVAGLLLIAALLFAVRYNLFWFPASSPGLPPAPADDAAARAATAEQPAGIVRTGSVENSAVVPIHSEFSGRISELYVKEGQAVKAGQPLFKLEGLPAGAAADLSPGAAPSGKDNYEKALNEYNRLQKLYEIGAIPRRQLENAAARLQELKDGGSSGQKAANAAALQGPVTVTAPVDGIVTGLAAAAGSPVEAGRQVLALGGGQALEVVVPLAQDELYLVHLGTPVTIEAEGHTLAGQVSSIFPEVQNNQISSFLAHIKPADLPAGLLKAGMAVKVHMTAGP